MKCVRPHESLALPACFWCPPLSEECKGPIRAWTRLSCFWWPPLMENIMIQCSLIMPDFFWAHLLRRVYTVNCTVGWVNLYQKFEIEKYTVCGKLILLKKMERHFYKFFSANWLANLHGFSNIRKLPVSNTFKCMHSKIL